MNIWSGRLLKHPPFQLLWIGLLVLLLASLVLAGLSSADPLTATVSITADAAQVVADDEITYNFSLVNTGVPTDVIFYAPIPEGAVFSSVEGATPYSYTIGLRAPNEIKSISWAGILTDTHLITLTTVISGPGSAPGGDIAVQAHLIDPPSGVSFYNIVHITDYVWPNELFLPLVTRADTTNPNITPTPTPIPGSLQVDGIMGTYTRQANLYDDALNADITDPRGDIGYQYNLQPDYFEVGQWGIDDTPHGFNEYFRIMRGFIDFDTTQIQTQPTTVTLYVRISDKTPGVVMPQIVHKGTWNGYMTQDPEKWLRWKNFEATELARYLETDSTSQTLELSLPLPSTAINVGGVTHLVIRSGEEGTPPPTGDYFDCTECKRRVGYSDIKLILAW